jgi:hypothetical protein
VRPTVCLLGGSSKPWASATTSQLGIGSLRLRHVTVVTPAGSVQVLRPRSRSMGCHSHPESRPGRLREAPPSVQADAAVFQTANGLIHSVNGRVEAEGSQVFAPTTASSCRRSEETGPTPALAWHAPEKTFSSSIGQGLCSGRVVSTVRLCPAHDRSGFVDAVDTHRGQKQGNGNQMLGGSPDRRCDLSVHQRRRLHTSITV